MRLEKKATLISTSVAGVLVILKMGVALFSGSIAVLASAIDSMLDLFVSLFNYFALHNSEKNPDHKFQFGRSKIEPLAAVVEGSVILLSALFILYNALLKIVHPKELEHMQESVIVILLSFFITAALVLFLRYVAKKTNNLVIRSDSLHYQTDLFSNGAVLFTLAAISYTGEQLIDPILGIAISFYIIYSAIPLIREGVLMLLDAALPPEDIEAIKKILEEEPVIQNYHYLQTRESASHVFVSVHVVFNVSISLYDAHIVSDKIEAKIKEYFKDKKAHILIHMDPYDDSELNEDKEEW